MSDSIQIAVTPALIADALQKCGYRAQAVERDGVRQLQSAAQGLGFFVSFGNPAAVSGSFIDYSFQCWIAIEGTLAPELIDSWNRGKRFARLYRQEQMLVLIMDVLVAGGVTENYLRAQVEIWDRVLHDFVQHLRQSVPVTTAANPSAATAEAA